MTRGDRKPGSRGRIPKLRSLKEPEDLERRSAELGIELAFDAEMETGRDAPLAQPLQLGVHRVGNRFAILPMEGWDATRDGRPSDLVRRRWRRFGASGAKLVWGGEAVAVRPEGRANPHQLAIGPHSASDLLALRRELVAEHERCTGAADDLLVGLQLTHSGRFARPDGVPRPRIAYRHPRLDARVGVDSDAPVLSDAEIEALVGDFAAAAACAREAGFHFVDVKHCHGYLGHELLSGFSRPGPYGGDLEGRTRFLRDAISAIRNAAPGLGIGVRLSAFDFAPFRVGPDGTGEIDLDAPGAGYAFAFGGDGTGAGIDLAETHALLDRLEALGVRLVCVTAGSPYYNPHIQRPAYFPPSDGYRPPEDPLVGVARQLAVTAELRRRHPGLAFVGSGYSYLQEWLPHVAQRALRDGAVDSVGIGRMALSYPELPGDVLAGRALDHRRICRTFSDCTTAPRNGLVSGCYPLDAFYKERPGFQRLAAAKRESAL